MVVVITVIRLFKLIKMACEKRIRTFISKTVLVSGKESAIREHDYYEIGVLPRYGDTNEVLAKCSPKDYHTYWVDVNSLIPPALDTDWVETATEVYNDTKPIGIGTSTPVPTNALTVVGNMNQSFNCNFIASGEGVYTPLFPVNWPVTVGGVQDIFSTGEYSYHAAYKDEFNAFYHDLMVRNEGIIPGEYIDTNIRMDIGRILLERHLDVGSNDEYDAVLIEQGGTTITSFDNALMQGRQYIFPTVGGMEMRDYTSALIYKMPNVDGANLEVLTTDGLGNLYWSSVAGVGAIVSADNGLNIDPANNVQLGGPLIEITNVDVPVGTELTFTSGVPTNTQIFVGEEHIEFIGGNGGVIQNGIIIYGLTNEMQFRTPFYAANTNSYVTPGKLLQNIDETSGLVEFTPFAFPLVDGTTNQVLSTDGAGNITFSNILGTLIQAGPGLTESPAGTIKLGDTDVSINESLSLALDEYWFVDAPVSVPNSNYSISSGLHPLMGVNGGFLNANITGGPNAGHFSVVAAISDGITPETTMYQSLGTNTKQVTINPSEINLENRTPGLANGQIEIGTGSLRFSTEDLALPNSVAIEMGAGTGTRFYGDLAGTPYSYTFPRDNGANLEVLINDGAGNLYWGSAAATGAIVTANNGLHIDPANNVKLGGLLIENTTINGNGNTYKMDFINGDSFTVNNFNSALINSGLTSTVQAPTTTVTGTSALHLGTPAVAGSNKDWILMSKAASTGECEWIDPLAASTVPLLANIYSADGTLSANRFVNGNSSLYSLQFEELLTFRIDSTPSLFVNVSDEIDLIAANNISLSSNEIELKGSTLMNIEAPNFAATQPGWVLKAQAAGTGSADWEELKHVLPFDLVDWAGVGPYNITIVAGIHGKGTDPIIQVFDAAGAMVIPGVGALTSIVVNGSGDITLNAPATFVGKVVIM
jgi:hypothetical protein